MLYRAAAEPNPEVWGLNVEHRVFHGDDVDAALEDGWVRHPRDVPEAPTGEDHEPKRKGRLPKEG